MRTNANPAPRPASGLRVFVVENHADTREFLTFMLEELGHTVMVADTMSRALRDVPAANCDVLISDIGLPDGDGWQLLARLDLPKPLYAIAMSGFGMTSDRLRSKAVGLSAPSGQTDGAGATRKHFERRCRRVGRAGTTPRRLLPSRYMVLQAPGSADYSNNLQNCARGHDDVCADAQLALGKRQGCSPPYDTAACLDQRGRAYGV